ncbi:hypothetical protein DL93DRAFT_2103095 [Clavulina sp. PMI_390]|nr:hypothetical protein DL93DRAFT_2103095 [Clavulina sp. PMI_390]
MKQALGYSLSDENNILLPDPCQPQHTDSRAIVHYSSLYASNTGKTEAHQIYGMDMKYFALTSGYWVVAGGLPRRGLHQKTAPTDPVHVWNSILHHTAQVHRPTGSKASQSCPPSLQVGPALVCGMRRDGRRRSMLYTATEPANARRAGFVAFGSSADRPSKHVPACPVLPESNKLLIITRDMSTQMMVIHNSDRALTLMIQVPNYTLQIDARVVAGPGPDNDTSPLAPDPLCHTRERALWRGTRWMPTLRSSSRPLLLIRPLRSKMTVEVNEDELEVDGVGSTCTKSGCLPLSSLCQKAEEACIGAD